MLQGFTQRKYTWAWTIEKNDVVGPRDEMLYSASDQMLFSAEKYWSFITFNEGHAVILAIESTQYDSSNEYPKLIFCFKKIWQMA